MKKPLIRSIFLLTKIDSSDFNRDDVTYRIGVQPTATSAPSLSKGKLCNPFDIQRITEELQGITILCAENPPYPMLKHAYWSIETPKIECWNLKDSLQQLACVLHGKELEISEICNTYRLYADLIIQVFASSDNMPQLFISNEELKFWTSTGAKIGFDFYLD